MQWGKGNNQTFGGLLVTDSEETPIPRDPKCPQWPTSQRGAHGIQVISGVSAQIHLAAGPRLQALVISSAPEFIIQIDVLNNWHDPHTGEARSCLVISLKLKRTGEGLRMWLQRPKVAPHPE